ncbi:related to RNA binding protein Nrd1 (Negative regulator of differentiation) [Melanopsichium pennsylvanicum]|uniref:Related to RNA binding protein Nrd1 (Negative regulator of differentiation) n=2 Tax=Melanopsichium pennsylvanicum TaxID=63383 RepID=A0AAJ5C4T0_9BASI|nr:related to RNA binding protein Nrd1 (Negative regulator of differentiation) [Melanopsichium pennsylvanicum 4]SNX83987.1 related to RNA binding protein Nrd1 (Negative regulator of differentiation) [Melanopsichium pennsylvanicum]
MHEENTVTASNTFASNGYNSINQPNAANAPGYALDTLGMMKRAPSQSYDAQASLGHLASLPNAQMPDSGAKKARFVSEGNIPSFAHQNLVNSSTGVLGSYPPTAGASPHAQAPFLANGAAPQAQAQFSGAAGLQPPGNGTNGTRSFSGNIGHAGLLGTQNGHNFDAAGSAPFLMSNGAGMNPAGAMFPSFAANFANTPGFVPNVAVLSAMPRQVNPLNRTVYVGNLPADASVDELLNLVKFGPIENVRILPEKNCAFISFLDGSTATAFHADACVKKVSLHNQELKIGWGKPSQCHPAVLMAVQQNQASRNVYVGQLDESASEQSLRDDLSRFGPIDQVKIVRDKNIGFIHFLSIQTAMKVVATLPTEPVWTGKRVSYGKDRCAYVPKSQQQNQAHNNQAAAMGLAAATSLGYPTAAFAGANNAPDNGRSPASSVFGPAAAMMGANATALEQLGNRTIYLGNIHPETTTAEICNHIRGGILQNVRFIPEKHIAFVTFVDPNAALAFYHLASYSGIMIHNRRLKIGWGKHSGPLSPAIQFAVQAGGSRNVYIGNIDDPDHLTEDKIRNDFSQYGEIETVNGLREKNCAFANFTNIQSAIKCIEGMKSHPDYQSVKISYGKDRCGNPPRSVGNNVQGDGARKASGSVSPNASALQNQGDDTMVTASESVQDLSSVIGGDAGMAVGASDDKLTE